MPLAPLFGTAGARFDALKFNWLGSLDRADGMCTVWHTSPIKTWADMLEKELVVGSTGAGSQFSILPAMLNKLFGTRIKVINGYKDGGEIFQAMEKGEIEGRCSTQLTAIQSIRPQWLTEHKLAVPILIGRKRIPEFPDTPAVMEFAKDAATRAQLELMLLTQDMDRPVLLPPGVPAERVAQMRAALFATMADPAFVTRGAKHAPASRAGARRGPGQGARRRLRAAARRGGGRAGDHGREVVLSLWAKWCHRRAWSGEHGVSLPRPAGERVG